MFQLLLPPPPAARDPENEITLFGRRYHISLRAHVLLGVYVVLLGLICLVLTE